MYTVECDRKQMWMYSTYTDFPSSTTSTTVMLRFLLIISTALLPPRLSICLFAYFPNPLSSVRKYRMIVEQQYAEAVALILRVRRFVDGSKQNRSVDISPGSPMAEILRRLV